MNLFKSISIYTISNIARQAVAFLLLPIISTYLSTSENGDLSTLMAIVSLLTPLVMLSAHGAINLEYFRQDQGTKNFSSYVSSAMINPLWIFGLLAVVTYAFGQQLSNWLELDLVWIYLIPTFCLLSFLPQLVSVIYQIKKLAIHYAAFNISLTLFELCISIYLIVGLQMNWEGRAWGVWSSKFIFAGIAFYLLYRFGLLTKKIKPAYIKDALFFGLPLIPHILSAGIMDLSDRLFIREMISREELGIYDIGYKVGSIIMIVQASLVLAWSPYFYEKLKNITQDIKIQLVSMSYLLMLGLVVAGLGLTIVAPLIFYFFVGENFSDGLQYVSIIAFSYVFLGFYKIFACYIFYLKKTFVLSYIAVINILLNLTLNYILIGYYGAMGAAYATLISYFSFFLIVAITSYFLYPMPWFSFKAIGQFFKKNIKI